MTPPPARHARFHESVGAYVLGALTGPEVAAFEEHLGSCAVCRDDVDSLRAAAAVLPDAAEPLRPPPELKRRVMEVVDAEAGLLRARRSPAPATRRRRTLRLPSPRPALAGGLVAALAAVGGFAVGGGLSSGPSGRVIGARLSAALPSAASARLEVAGDRAVLRVRAFPRPPAGRVYQVWEQSGPAARPAATPALFVPGAYGGAAVELPAGATRAARLLVTAEPAGGSRTGVPSRPPLLAVTTR